MMAFVAVTALVTMTALVNASEHHTASRFSWGALIVEECVRLGVRDFFATPGSRHSGLIVALLRHPNAQLTMHFDERGAAFAALGHAKGSGRPAGVVTTSGTAVAELLPAVVEASLDHVPLLLLTADRPAELRDCGANQSIAQRGIFSNFVRWQFSLPCQTASVPCTFVLTTVDEAVNRSLRPTPGPVHLNLPFRAPLLASPEDSADRRTTNALETTRHDVSLTRWAEAEHPYASSLALCPQPPAQLLREQLRKLVGSGPRRGLLLMGRGGDSGEKDVALRFAEQSKWPIVADVTSPCFSAANHPMVVTAIDHLLASPQVVRAIAPDLIVHCGGRLLSKQVNAALAAWDSATVCCAALRSLSGRTRSTARQSGCGVLRLRCSLSWGAFCR